MNHQEHYKYRLTYDLLLNDRVLTRIYTLLYFTYLCDRISIHTSLSHIFLNRIW